MCQPVHQLAVTSRSPVAPNGPTRVPEGRGTHRCASRGAVSGTHRWRRRRRHHRSCRRRKDQGPPFPRGSSVRAEVPPVIDPEAP